MSRLASIKFPKTIKHDQTTYKLVLVRKIPRCPAAAIYRSMPVFHRGKLIEDYLIVGPKLQALQQCPDLTQALHRLFLSQNKIKEQTRLQTRLAQRKSSQASKHLPERNHSAGSHPQVETA